jgi:PKD repeat protein
VGRVVQFSASANDGNPDDVLSYTWDFGDGKTATGPTAHHPYVAPGTYPVTLTVSDGLSTATDTASVGVAPGGPQDFTDTFNRSNAASLGNGWEEAQGAFVIQNNEARNVPGKNAHIAIQPAVFGLAHAAGATFASVDNNTAPRVGIVLRFIDPQNYYLFYRQMGGSSVLRIARIANGIETTLASIGTPNAIVNTPFRLTADATGSALVLRLCHANDTSTMTTCVTKLQELKATDSALVGGSVGVLLGTGSGSTQQYRADNFVAKVR